MWGIIYTSYYSGGLSSPVMIWMGIVPILPLFIAPRSWSHIWLFVTFFIVIFIYWGQTSHFLSIVNTETYDQLALRATMIGMLCITQMVLVMTYDSVNLHIISRVRKKNNRLIKISNDLKILSSNKDKFLTSISHEIRTPLNAVTGYLELLNNNDASLSKFKEYASEAKNASVHLMHAINDLLDFSQIQQGKFTIQNQLINLHKTLIDVHQSLRQIAKINSTLYKLEIDSTTPRLAITDPQRLSQILLNLLKNALFFTKGGVVTTFVKYDFNTQFLTINVTDTGLGIHHSYHEYIFEPFFQVPLSISISSENALRGNGLGLSITKSLIKKMGGAITLQSLLNTGSEFRVLLPIKVPQNTYSHDLTQSDLINKSFNILIVDDHATNRIVVMATLKKFLPNAVINQASNGTEAINNMSCNFYDLVIMDLYMPDFSGIDVVRQVRLNAPSPMSSVKVIVLTANIEENTIKECNEVGVLDVLPKPFVQENLIRTILSYF